MAKETNWEIDGLIIEPIGYPHQGIEHGAGDHHTFHVCSPPPEQPHIEDKDHSLERAEFKAAVAERKECEGVKPGGGGCACTGRCLGSALAVIRKKYDSNHEDLGQWISDQLHGVLRIRPGDSGRPCAVINAENYWTGVQ